MSQQDMDLLLWLHAEAVWREKDLTRQRDQWWEVQSVRIGAVIVERDEAVRALERLHSWAGLMELLDEHWPADVFDGQSDDPGPRIVSLIRALDRSEASRRDWAAEADRLQHAYDETVRALSEEIAWQKDAYRDGHKNVRTEVLASGRTIGMEDARRTLTETFARSLPLCAVHPEPSQIGEEA